MIAPSGRSRFIDRPVVGSLFQRPRQASKLRAMRDPRKQIIEAGSLTYQHTRGQLSKNKGPGTCAALSRRVAGVIGKKFDDLQRDGAGMACAAGCHFCCYLRVSILPHEAIALLRHLREKLPAELAADVERKIHETASTIDGMTQEEHFATNLKCAFLVDGRCSAYDVRPSACAAYHSMSKGQCEYSYNNPRDFGTATAGKPTLFEMQAFGDAQADATQAAVQSVGLVSERSELHQSLRELLTDPEAVSRWQGGGRLVEQGQPSSGKG
jgi:Fe-S-cluster containining protein